jgi:hypothetical protein
MRKKLAEERRYLALEDLWIKSKFPRLKMRIREVGYSGETKNSRGRRKKRKKARGGRGAGHSFKQSLGATPSLAPKLMAPRGRHVSFVVDVVQGLGAISAGAIPDTKIIIPGA